MDKKFANRQSQFRLKPVYAAVLLAFAAQTAQANPTGANVVNGSASFATSGNTLTVTNTPGTIINWQGFSIGSSEVTRFAQQSASSTVLNRVVSNNPSNILGTLQSNGRVFLVNPNGILFGAGAVVDVAGLVASTLNLSDADFKAGNNHFTEVPGAASISNAGNITAQDNGQIFLIAPNVENTGVITAPNGEILLAAGHSVDLVSTNDPNLRVKITAPAGDATNVGQLIASSGSLGLFGTVVRNSGTVNADSATLQGGKIVFKATQRVDAGGTISAQGAGGGTITLLADIQGGTVNVDGILDASAPVSGNGGFIETSAAYVQVVDTAHITTAAVNGSSGNWLIDPVDFTIATAGGNITGVLLSNMLTLSSVTIQTATGTNTATNLFGTTGTNGDIFVNDAVAWNANTLTLNASRNIYINANMNGNLAAAFAPTAGLALLYGQGAVSAGNTANYVIAPGVKIDLSSAGSFSTKLGSDGAITPYTIITTLGAEGSLTGTDLQGMSVNPSGNYVLGTDIDASNTSNTGIWTSGLGFAPVGNTTSAFAGQFDGLGHTISGLYINRPATNYVGLFGYVTGGSIRNVGMVGANVTGSIYVGGLAGLNYFYGAISNSYVSSGSVTGTSYVGGLVGYNYGKVSNSHYNINAVLINGSNYVTLGGLYNDTITQNGSGQYDDWVNSGLKLDIANYASLPGSANNYSIVDVQGMKDMLGFSDISSYTFSLAANIDLTNVPGLYIPYLAGHFNGSFKGVNYTISYLSVFQSFNDNLGLFGNIATGGTVSNVTLKNASVTGNATVGMLAGWNQGTISTSHIDNSNAYGGNVSGTYNIGGLVGTNDGSISGSYIDNSNSLGGGYVSGTANVGGLVGNNNGTISNSYVDNTNAYGGRVSGTNYIGGLVGNSNGTISGSHINGGTVSGASNVGGLAGYNSGGNISGSYVSGGTVNATGNDVGGLVGSSQGGSAIISASYVKGGSVTGAANVGGLVGYSAYGSITGSNVDSVTVTGSGSRIGGLVGYIASSVDGGCLCINIVNSYVNNGTVSGASSVGGLAGQNDGSDISGSYVSNGTVTATGINAGGLVGFNRSGSGGIISASHAIGTSVTGGTNVGGLVGFNGTGSATSSGNAVGNTITGSYVSGGTVTASGDNVGGLVGNNAGDVVSSYVSGSSVISAVSDGSGNGGGLVGYNSGSIGNSFVSNGSVSGSSSAIAWTMGGLVGNNAGSISNTYVSGGTVSASSTAGGLVGYNSGTISNSYASTGVLNGGTIGGLVGNNAGTVTASFWNTTVAGAGVSSGIGTGINTGATGLTSAGMMTMSNFTAAGWSISTTGVGTIWRIQDGITMPLLSVFGTAVPVVPSVIDEIVDITNQREKPKPEEFLVAEGTLTDEDGNLLPMCN